MKVELARKTPELGLARFDQTDPDEVVAIRAQVGASSNVTRPAESSCPV